MTTTTGAAPMSAAEVLAKIHVGAVFLRSRGMTSKADDLEKARAAVSAMAEREAALVKEVEALRADATQRGLLIDQLESDLTQSLLGEGHDLWDQPKVRGQKRRRNRFAEVVQLAIASLRAIDAARAEARDG